MTNLDWNDLRFVLAAARHGSIRQAAKALKVNHATVSRHLARLEAELGVRLLDREGRTLAPTPAGAELIDVAEQIEASVLGVERRILGRDTHLRGVVRLALPGVMLWLLRDDIRAFSAAYPELTLEFVTGMALVNLTRREADVSIRFTQQPPESYFGRRVGAASLEPFGQRALLDRLEPCPITTYPWVFWDERYDAWWPARWLGEQLPPEGVRFRATAAMDILNVVSAGAAVGFMLSLIGHSHPELRRLNIDAPAAASDLWVLTHEALRRNARVKAVLSFFADALSAHLAAASPGHHPPGAAL